MARKLLPRWLHLSLLLLVMTMFSTTLVGAHMQYNFSHNLPFFEIENYSDIFTLGLGSPRLFFAGLPFSLTLLNPNDSSCLQYTSYRSGCQEVWTEYQVFLRLITRLADQITRANLQNIDRRSLMKKRFAWVLKS